MEENPNFARGILAVLSVSSFCSEFACFFILLRIGHLERKDPLETILQAVEGLAAKWDRKVVGGAVIDCS